MTAHEYLHALGELEHRLNHLSGAAARQLTGLIADSKTHCAAGEDGTLAPLFWQFRLVDLSHRVCRAECETAHIVASGWAGTIAPRIGTA